MDEIKQWFDVEKKTSPDKEAILNKINEGISEKGYDNSALEGWIDKQLKVVKANFHQSFKSNTND